MLTKGFTSKKFYSMFFASFFGWIISIIGELSDSIFSGLFISETAVAAVGLVYPIYDIIYFFAMILAIGISTKYSNYSGSFDTATAKKVNSTGIITALGMGVLMALALVLLENRFFLFYATTPEIEALAREYYTFFIPFVLISPVKWVVYCLVLADGDEINILLIDVLEAIGNVAISLILVQTMGIKGLALGTVLASIGSILILSCHFLSKHNSLHFGLEFNWKLLEESFIAGSSTALNYLYFAVVDILVNKYIIARFGDAYLPAYAVINLIVNLSSILICAMDASAPFVGVAYGEKNNRTIRTMVKKASILTVVCSAILSLILVLGSSYIPSIYGIESPEIIRVSVYATRAIAMTFIFFGFGYGLNYYYTKTNKPGLSNIIVFVQNLAAPLLLSLVLGAISFEAFSLAFALSPAIAILVEYICISVKYGTKAFPYVLEEHHNTIYEHEFAVNESELQEVQEILRKELSEGGITEDLSSKVLQMFLETMMVSKEKNPEGKKILAACTIIIDEDNVRLITRDNGIIFDIKRTRSRRGRVALRLMREGKESRHMTSISFNRNSYLWERNHP